MPSDPNTMFSHRMGLLSPIARRDGKLFRFKIEIIFNFLFIREKLFHISLS